MSKQRYENKTAYDPGRFRYAVTFIEEVGVLQPDLSSVMTYSAILSTIAIRQAVTRRFSVFGDLSVNAGSTDLSSYWYFIVRFRKGFVPKKNMLLQAPDGIYTITESPELDDPPNYWKLLCTKTDKIITT